MNITVNQHQFSLDEHGTRFFKSRGGHCCTAAPINEFSMQIQCAEQQYALIPEQFLKTQTPSGTLYENSFAQVALRYEACGNAIAKKITVTARQAMTLLYIQTEYSRFDEALCGGGEGQPVFVGDSCFVVSTLPVAISRIVNGYCLSIEQSPWKALQPGEVFTLYDVVFGFSEKADIRDSFVAWLRSRRRNVAGHRIFCDWGAHDEMAGDSQLDEQMALRLADRLAYAASHGVRFDSYLMDAYWFEEHVPAPDFKKSTWPKGPDRFLTRLKELGIAFGLWFDVGLAVNGLGSAYRRRNDDGAPLCLGCEENVRLLFSGIRKQLDATNARLIKLDFAAFDCTSSTHPHAQGGIRSKEPAVRNLLSQLQHLREAYPQLLVLAYNTFTINESVIAQLDENEPRAVISAIWCLYLDYIYCGDPRPAEQLSADMPHSLLAYTDTMEQRFLRAMIPPEAIDDHGTMLGNTNTIYYLGKASFRDSWIMNLSRGNRKQHLYGELSLLDDADWAFLAQSIPLFERTLSEGWTVRLHGDPMHGAYAYSCFDERGGFLTLVNPSSQEQTLCVTPDCWRAQEQLALCLRYSEQAFTEKNLGKTARALVRTLRPGSVELITWQRCQPACREGFLVLDSAAALTFTVPENAGRIGFRLTEENGAPIRTFGTPTEALHITGNLARQLRTPIWSGCSWITCNCHGGETVLLRSDFERRVLLYWQADNEEKRH